MSSEVRLAFERSLNKPAVRPRLRTVQRGDPGMRWVEGDNLLALHALRDELAGQVTLAYLDPPFLTGRAHHRVERSRSSTGTIRRVIHHAFDDRWGSLAEYLDALGQRLSLVRD